MNKWSRFSVQNFGIYLAMFKHIKHTQVLLMRNKTLQSSILSSWGASSSSSFFLLSGMRVFDETFINWVTIFLAVWACGLFLFTILLLLMVATVWILPVFLVLSLLIIANTIFVPLLPFWPWLFQLLDLNQFCPNWTASTSSSLWIGAIVLAFFSLSNSSMFASAF